MEQSCYTHRKDVLILELVSIYSGLKIVTDQVELLTKQVDQIVLMLKVLKEMDADALKGSEEA